jgi:alpha-N-arabinofuranosidase
LGRETFLTKVHWAEDGFPVFGDAGHTDIDVEAALPGGGEQSGTTLATLRDDFSSQELDLDWNHLRNPKPECHSLRERRGCLRLRGSADGLDDVAAPAWIGRRQCHFAVRAATCLEFLPSTEREEAGLVVWMNERHHYEVFVTQRNGKPVVVLRRRIGRLQVEQACHALSEGQAARLVLCVDANKDRYEFSYGSSKDDLQTLGEGETRYLSTEVAGGFTGVYFAMYASGNGAPCRTPADFDWFDYEVRDGDG